MTRRQRDNLIFIFIALGSVIFLKWVIPAYTPPYPGYGVKASLLPNIAVSIILIISIIVLITNLLTYILKKEVPAEDAEYPDENESGGSVQTGKINLLHLAKFLIPSALLMPAMQWMGFIPAGIIFMLVIQYFCGRREPVAAVVVAVATVLLIYTAMRYGFGVPMP